MSKQTKFATVPAVPSRSADRKGDPGFKAMVVRAGCAYLRALRRNGQSIGQASFFAL